MRRALLSFHDVEALVRFGSFLVELGVELIAPASNARALRARGVSVTELQAFTGVPAAPEGAPESLHPRVIAAILADDSDSSRTALLRLGALPIDLVAADLPPVPLADDGPAASLDALLALEDVSQVALLRSAARNHARVVVLSSRDDQDTFLGSFGQTTPEMRREFARRTVIAIGRHLAALAEAVSYFDAAGARRATPSMRWVAVESDSPTIAGDNPGQSAMLLQRPSGAAGGLNEALFYARDTALLPSLPHALAATVGLELVACFDEPAAAVVVRRRPVAVATGPTLAAAVRAVVRQFASRTATLAMNRTIDRATEALLRDVPMGCVAAPSLDPDGLDDLRRDPNRCIIATGSMPDPERRDLELIPVTAGYLAQPLDTPTRGEIVQASVTSLREATPAERHALDLAWTVAARAPSDAVVAVAAGDDGVTQTVAISASATSRLDALVQCLSSAAERAVGCVIASDGALTSAEEFDLLAEAGVRALAHPGSIAERALFASHGDLAVLVTSRSHLRS